MSGDKNGVAVFQQDVLFGVLALADVLVVEMVFGRAAQHIDLRQLCEVSKPPGLDERLHYVGRDDQRESTRMVYFAAYKELLTVYGCNLNSYFGMLHQISQLLSDLPGQLIGRQAGSLHLIDKLH